MKLKENKERIIYPCTKSWNYSYNPKVPFRSNKNGEFNKATYGASYIIIHFPKHIRFDYELKESNWRFQLMNESHK